MLYIVIENSKAVDAVHLDDLKARGIDINKTESRWDWHKNPERLVKLIDQLNEKAGARKYIFSDSGPSVSPQYDIVRMPQVGDPVSKYFNGDSYPCGQIESISKSGKKIVTTDGTVFWKYKNTGSWLNNGTWSMTEGHVYKQNLHF